MQEIDRHQVQVDARLRRPQREALAALGNTNFAEGLASLAEVALQEWLDWLAAEDRPATLTELAKRRAKALLDAGLLPALPTAPVVAQRMRLTLGQARYIVNTLALENPAASAQTREGLAGRLRRALGTVGVPNPDALDAAAIDALKNIEQDLQFDAPKAEGVLALAVHEELLNERYAALQELNIAAFQAPKVKRQTDSYVRIVVRPHVAASILARIRGRQP
jgi:hypothetical protein